MAKAFPQGLESGEEFRDNDILGLYKPDDTASAVDGSLNKSKTIAELKTMIENEVINTNTTNIATNSSDITALEGRATVNENDIDALETRATTNEGDIDALEGKVGQSLNTTDGVTFASVTTNNVAIKHKLFTGTTDASGDIDISNTLTGDIDPDKILSIRAYFNNEGSWILLRTNSGGDDGLNEYNRIASDGSVTCGGSALFSPSKPYRVLVTYEA